jgi:hypothetical protein
MQSNISLLIASSIVIVDRSRWQSFIWQVIVSVLIKLDT